MMVVSLFPLVLSVTAALFFLFSDEIGLVGKLLAAGLVGGSLIFQFVPAAQVHFLVPLGMQLAVCFWWALFWQMNQ